MVLHNELSMMNMGATGHAAFAAWMRDSLSKRFDTVLQEPVPPVLLSVLEGSAVAPPARDKPGRVKS